jgi:hypothetical protein
MQGRNVVTRFYFLFLTLAVSALGPLSAFAQEPLSGQTTQATRPRQVYGNQIYLSAPLLSGDIETVNSQYRINLANLDQTRLVRGFAVIHLGNSEQLAEAIKLRFALGPQERMLFPLWPLSATGDYFSLMVYDLRGALIYQKIAPVKKGSEASWAVAPPMNSILNSRTIATTPSGNPDSAIKVQAKLTGGESESDPFFLSLELTAARPVAGAGITVTGKGISQRKVSDLKGTTLVQFKLPDELPEQKLAYVVTDASGRMLAHGEADLHTLLADDYVSVSEVRPDRQAYASGDTAKLTVNLQGSAPQGFRLEVLAKDSKGTIFFRDMRKLEAGANSPSLDFSLAIPKDASGQVFFEYKVFDAQSGKLFDSGDTELAVTGQGQGD